MADGRAYLDWNATTPVLPAATAAVVAALECFGNPSSIHVEGRSARAMLESARVDVAALVGGDASNVVFTSGATEAANALMASVLGAHPQARLFVSAVEHVAVLACAPASARAVCVSVDGAVDPVFFRLRLGVDEVPVVFLQLANNETGVIQPIEAMAHVVHAHGGLLIVDAVQGPGKIPVDMHVLGADAVFLSAHKFGGPKGGGAIVFRDAASRLANAFIKGGGQERGARAGTENVPGIAGMGAAARTVRAMGEVAHGLSHLRDHFESRLSRMAPDVRILGKQAPRLPNTSCFAIPGVAADVALIALDLDGVSLSSGSACSSGKVKPSHVLAAMGEPDRVIAGALRLSVGHATTMDEIERCLISLEKIIARRSRAVQAA